MTNHVVKNVSAGNLSLKEYGEFLKDPNTSPYTFALLAEAENFLVRERVARNPNTPADVLVKLANDPTMDVRCTIATNSNTPPDTLTLLAEDKSMFVRINVAANPSTPPDALVLLTNDWGWDNILEKVAQNPNTPPDTLARLAEHEAWHVCADVAQNMNTPPDTLAKLAEHEHYLVCIDVATHPNTPRELCLSIYNDLVQKDKIDEEFAIEIVQRNILPQTEVLALVALYGEKIAQVVAVNVTVAKNSLLEKVLAEYNCQFKIKSPEKDTNLARN